MSKANGSLRGLSPHLAVLTLSIACMGPAVAAGEAEPEPKVVPPTEAVWNPDLSEADPGPLEPSEVYRVLQADPRCSFHYTQASPPVIVLGQTAETGELLALMKLHGRLVRLTPASATRFDQIIAGGTFEAEGIVARIMPETEEQDTTEDDRRRWPANMRFELDEGLSVGYRGWYVCD
ncbi:hypothetical protein SAMN05216421_1775 [Halopseudomonas xinjiangensis]|uniref:Uncharacterized protein n=1 Tax=Halopseudomonas xinjiangensis TaxID=487184 RepID=A0A1H1TC06_9GAMM|nr:hypothetical protein [Halopseudomonas xinjiangensis]SDS57496.1 hypothetical protein SAMN05216421_1775 [Halopseudomonas xinjiangensis]